MSKVGGSHLCQGGMPLPPGADRLVWPLSSIFWLLWVRSGAATCAGTNYLTVCKGVDALVF